jgi:3-hydroxy-3-methylglutaryl CoA synthase
VLEDVASSPEDHGKVGELVTKSAGPAITAIASYSAEIWERRGLCACLLGRELGDCGNASVLMGLASLIGSKEPLVGRRVLMFGFGEGFSSSMFTLYFRADSGRLLERIQESLELKPRLSSRHDISTVKNSKIEHIPSNTYYLLRTNTNGHRFYALKYPPTNSPPKL